jgi:outer membrane lipoprotein SlyB
LGVLMRIFLVVLFIIALLQLTACAAHPDPIIDTKGVDPDAMAQDWDECEVYTEEISVAQGTAKGAGLGAAVGTLLGSIGGGYHSVAESAAYGAVYGGTDSGLQADRDKQQVFKKCMRGRGYRVLN